MMYSLTVDTFMVLNKLGNLVIEAHIENKDLTSCSLDNRLYIFFLSVGMEKINTRRKEFVVQVIKNIYPYTHEVLYPIPPS